MILFAIVNKQGEIQVDSKTGASAYETQAQADKILASLKGVGLTIQSFRLAKTLIV